MTTSPAAVNFKFYPRATFSETITLKDSLGALMDLTGYSARLQIKRDATDTTPLYDLSTSGVNPGLVLGGAAGTVAITIPYTATDDVTDIDPDGEAWVYDLLLSNDNLSPPVVDRMLQGVIIVLPGVTVPA